jgi:hypothetical protein
MPKKKPAHYVSNKDLLVAMEKFRDDCKEAEESGEDKPKVPEYIGECILKIANGLSNRPNFINYTYKDEMISDGIENCLQYIYNFNPKKSKNPFAYFTQIIYYAFIRRIQKEKKQQHIKHKMIDGGEYEQMPGDPNTYTFNGQFNPLVMVPDEPVYKTKEKKKNNKGLEKFMEDEND